MCRPVTSEAHLWDGRQLADCADEGVDEASRKQVGGPSARLRVQGMSHAQLSASPPAFVAAFVPEAKVRSPH